MSQGLRPCMEPRCPKLVRHGKCDAHQAPASEGWTRPTAEVTPRIRGRKLQRMRKALFEREPYCRTCRAKGRFTIATIRDHVIPLAEGGSDDDANEQPLCQTCSDIKTREESARGVRRSWD